MIFSLFQFVLFVILFARRSLLSFSDMAYQLSAMADYFVIATLVPMGVLALLVSISNISLIRHEGKRPANLLGIAISIAWLAVIYLWYRWWSIGEGMNWSYETLSIVSCLIAVAIAFGECLLLSTTTRENMAYSREVIEHHAGCDANEVSVAFSTTNYHVFRGYVCAHQAGMDVEGMGSKTRAYFWPNAFLREFAGLLVVQWHSILQTYLVIAVIYAFAEYVLLLA